MIGSWGKKFFYKTGNVFSNWSGYDINYRGGRFIYQCLRKFVQKGKSEIVSQEDGHASFEALIKQHGLTEQVLLERKRRLLSQCVIYLVLGLGLFLYGCFCLSHRSIYAFFVSLLLTLMMLACAYRAHFWVFQIVERRLGCTYRDWLAAVISGEKI